MPLPRLGDLLQPAFDLAEERQLPTGTGFADLDGLIGGLWPGDLWVVTGRPGAGKSVLALDLIRSVALRHRLSAALVQTREEAVDTAMRLLAAQARVPIQHLRLGGMTDDDWARLARSAGEAELADAPLLVDAAEIGAAYPPSAADQVLRAEAVARAHVLHLLVVDDLPGARPAEHLGRLKRLAVRAEACVVAVLDEDPEPAVRALAEADACRVADVVVRVDRDHELPGSADRSRDGEADLVVLRHRRGPVAVITLHFQGHYSRFVDPPHG